MGDPPTVGADCDVELDFDGELRWDSDGTLRGTSEVGELRAEVESIGGDGTVAVRFSDGIALVSMAAGKPLPAVGQRVQVVGVLWRAFPTGV